ncbi:proteoglycan 4 isoform X1 [Dendroctonus ponderosae]|uniref:proteoglycan 4 isoform X1 n=1 Tax=Dendroctonus ponderosae TaxID=77166 RepID=UPI0020354B63|nr:proteoglycan 4 isoform X1 [Dendroctonus ponderosae]XP_048518763.1 proteoglycan 4 isoform X1 [Dendroctonus ponderosae]
MGARHSKRSVDITTTPKKGGEGDDAKLEAVGEPDVKAATNGGLPSDIEFADKDESSKEEEEAVEVKENGVPEEAPASEETPEVTTPKADEPTEPKKKKEKKKKWSFRSISFSRKDKSKPSKEGGSDKNGDVAELAEESADSDKTPSPEGVAPVEGEAPAPLTNGDSAAPEPPAEPALAQQEEPVKADVAPSTVQPVQEEAVAHKEEAPLQVAQSAQQEEQPPVKEEPKPVKEEPKPAEEELPAATVEEEAVDTQPEAVEVVEPSIEVPPPLPASNPPSPVTVFAESTKAEAALTSGQLPLEEAEPVAQVAQIPLPVEQEVAKPDPSPSMEELPPAPPSPVPEVEPPAEPAEEEGPATPPPTLCPIFRQSRCPACRKQFPKAWRPSRFRPWTWSPPPSPTRPRRPQQRRRSPMATSTATARRHLSQRPRPRSPLNRLMPIKSAKSSRRPAIFRLTARWPRPRNSQWAGPKSRAGAFPGGPAPTTVRATNNQGPNKTETAIFQLLLNATVGVGARKFY